MSWYDPGITPGFHRPHECHECEGLGGHLPLGKPRDLNADLDPCDTCGGTGLLTPE